MRLLLLTIMLFSVALSSYPSVVSANHFSWLWHDEPQLTSPLTQFELDMAWLESLNDKPKIILLIDDIGDNFRLGKRAIDLPVALNLAFLPNTPFAANLAKYGTKHKHDILLHQPMEATTRPDLLGEGALRFDHSQEDVAQRFQANLAQFPNVVGFNNHMGSLLTTSKPHMNWLMEQAHLYGLYFVDSRTSAESIAYQVAKQHHIKAIGRDVFLDPTDDVDVVNRQLHVALKMARKRGLVVIIGHPYQSTLSVLEQQLPRIANDYHWLTVSAYWRYQRLLSAYRPYIDKPQDDENISITAF